MIGEGDEEAARFVSNTFDASNESGGLRRRKAVPVAESADSVDDLVRSLDVLFPKTEDDNIVKTELGGLCTCVMSPSPTLPFFHVSCCGQ